MDIQFLFHWLNGWNSYYRPMLDNDGRNLRVFLLAFTHLTCIIVAPLHNIYPHSHTAMRVFERGKPVLYLHSRCSRRLPTFSPFSYRTLPAFSHGGRVHYLRSSYRHYATLRVIMLLYFVTLPHFVSL